MRLTCEPCKRTCHADELSREGWYVLVRGDQSIISVLYPESISSQSYEGDREYACSQGCAVKIISRHLNKALEIRRSIESIRELVKE